MDDLHSWGGVAKVRQECEAQAAREGLAGIDLFFRGQNLFMERLQAAPTYRQRQEVWKAKQPVAVDPVLSALQEIADGHNDARGLAQDVLRKLNSKERSE